ncbi:MAG: MBL fold metallo-hydrolase [Candidatus Nezhaarchaeales archaeon]
MGHAKLLCLGGCREVGRSAYLLNLENRSFLLDYGVLLNDVPLFPSHVSPNSIDAVLLTHPHLDHSGLLPLLYSSRISPPIYTTKLNVEILEYLILDMMKLSGNFLPYEVEELYKAIDSTSSLYYKEELKLGEVTVKILNAGHVPGSCMFLLKSKNGKFKVLYTGDFSTIETRLINPVDVNELLSECPIDLVLMESTYGDRPHEDRRLTEKSFAESVADHVEDGGLVLVPAFAYGRAQEILCVLYKYLSNLEVYLDGMAKQVSLELLSFKEFLRDGEFYEEALRRAKFIRGPKDRRRILKYGGVVISPSGMLKGGPSALYARHLAERGNGAIFLVSYQIPNTPGDHLLKYGKLDPEESEKVKCDVKWFDFSSHAGKNELLDFITKIVDSSGGRTKVVLVHGEERAILAFEEELRRRGIDVVGPKNGDLLII